MKEILNWCLENVELIKDIIRLLMSIGAFTYATIIHWKSKKRLTALETEQEVKTDLIRTIQDLQKALENSKGGH